MQRTDEFNQRSCPRARIIKQEIQRDAFIYKFDQLGAR